MVIDSAADGIFVSDRFLNQLGSPPERKQNGGVIETAISGISVPNKGVVNGRLDMGPYSKTLDFTVGDFNGGDVFLGMKWLRSFKDKNLFVGHHSRTVRVRIGGKLVKLPPYDNDLSIKFVKANKMRELMRKSKNSEFFLVQSVRRVSEPKGARVPLEKPEASPLQDWILQEFPDVFRTELPPGLPPARPTDMTIELVPGATPVYKRQYRLNPHQASELDRQVDHHYEGGRCIDSHSEWNSPSIMERKIGTNELRWCVDYRGLNAVTKPDKFPIPIVENLIEKLKGAVVFSKIDFLHGYFQTRLDEASRKFTAFSTETRHLEFTIMPLGLKNAPACFMRLVNYVFAKLIGVCVIVFFDDICVYSKSEEEHTEHLRAVFLLMRENNLYGSFKKCMFYLSEVPFLGFIVGKEGLKTDPSIVTTVKDFAPPRNVKGVRTFLGLTGFYRKFVPGYAGKALPMTRLLQEQVEWNWDKECQRSFEELRNAIIQAPVLILPDFSKKFVLTVDAGNGTIAGVLQQDHGKGLQPIRFWSRKMNGAETRYTTTEQEMLALVESIRTFDYYLYGAPFILETDHRALVYLMTQPKLSPRQCRWLNTIAGFDFEIKYLEGRKNVVADGLTRMERIEDVIKKPSQELVFRKITSSVVDLASTIAATGYTSNEEKLFRKEGFVKKAKLFLKKAEDGNARDRICVPKAGPAIKLILESLHDEPTGGHLGVAKTLEAVKQRFYWKGMNEDVKSFVTSCVVCQKVQSSTQKQAGKIMPIPTPERPWERINWDFITGFPLTKKGKDAIATYVDPTTKMAHFSAVRKDDSAKDAVMDYIGSVVRLHGLQREIITDRDPKFTSEFHQELFKRLGVKRKLSTAYHPQTDGLAEVTNKSIIKMLRAFCSDQKDDWDEYLPILEFAFNAAANSVTGKSPFSLNGGVEPLRPIDLEIGVAGGRNETLEELQTRLATAREAAKKAIESAQEKMKKKEQGKKRDLELKVGDRVLLSAANLKLPPTPGSGSYKLNEKYVGPFKVVQAISKVNYKLDLPKAMRVHPVFHVSKLKKYKESSEKFGDRNTGPFSNEVIVNPEEEWVVEKIVDQGVNDDDKVVVLCKWKGYDDSDNTWEDVAFIRKEYPEVLEEWEKEMDAKFTKKEIAAVKKRKKRNTRKKVQRGR